MKIKRMRHILILALVLSLALTLIPYSTINADGGGAAVSIGAPAIVSAGGTFDVNINVSPVTNLNASQFDLSYDPTVIQVTGTEGGAGVSSGLIGNTSIPLNGWTFQPVAGTPSGTIRVISHMPGDNGIDGSGYLAQIHFNVLGAMGASTTLHLSGVILSDVNADTTTPATTDGSVTVGGLQITTTSPLPVGEAGITYSQTLAASGGTAPYTFSVKSGNLPSNLTLSSSGAITGTPASAAVGSTTITFQVTDSASPAATSTKAISITIVASPSITTTSLPDGTVGIAYSQTLAVSGGKSPYSWSVQNGNLPAGMGLDANTGAITGTPSTPGNSGTITFKVSDNLGGTATKDLTINIAAVPLPLSISTISLAGGIINVSYTGTLAAVGGVTPYTWSITAGNLPDGLSLDSSSGAITGTPTVVGSSGAITFKVTDHAGSTATKDLSITIGIVNLSVGAPAMVNVGGVFDVSINISPVTNLNASQFDLSYDPTVIQVSGTEGGTGVSSGLIGGTDFPLNGWTFQPIAGTPSGTIRVINHIPGDGIANGSGYITNIHFNVLGAMGASTTLSLSNASLADSDANSIALSTTDGLVTVVGIQITNASPLPDGEVGIAYSQTLAATGGTAPYTFSIKSGNLPSNLTLDSGGAITGTPTTAGGPTTVTFQATDHVGNTATKDLTITIVVAPSITTTALPNGTVGIAYSQTLAATGGKSPYTWSIQSGNLPAGLTLDSSSGAITGTPTGAGNSGTIKFKVVDNLGGTATKDLSINIVVPLTITTTSLAGGLINTPYSQTLAAVGGVTPYTWSIATGNLPDGLSLNASTGAITGTPTTLTLDDPPPTITFMVTDHMGTTATKDLSITIGIAMLSVGAPATVLAGGTLDVNINVSPVTNLNASQFDLSYDPTVIQVIGTEGGAGVTKGLIGGTDYPIAMWGFQPAGIPSGTIRVLQNIPGAVGTSGAGYVAQIHFNVLGDPGTSTPLHLFAVSFTDSNAIAIKPVSTTDGSVSVIAKLGFSAQPSGATAGSAFTTQPAVAIQDTNGNTVTNSSASVTLAITSGTGASGAVLSGTATVNAINGVAAFTGLSIDKVGTGYTLTATSGNFTPAVSSPFDVTTIITTPTKLAFSTQPSGATAGSAFTTQPKVAIQDAGGNTVTSSSAPVTLAITSGTGASGAVLSGNATVNAVNGVATFSGLSINLAGTGYTLTATSGSLTPAVSSPFDVTTTPVGPPTKLGFTTQPSGAGAGTAFTTQPAVTIQDANGNTVTSSSAPVTLAITSGTGASGAALSGTATVNAVNGVATFSGLSINMAGTGYTLTATSGSLTQAVSNPFDINVIYYGGGGGGGGGGVIITKPTITSVSPADGAKNVAVSSTVTAVFSAAMAIATINTTNFTLMNGSTAVTGTVTYDSTTKTATFTPSANLAPSTTYTATVTTDVTDLANNHMASNYTWSFTTGVVISKLALSGFKTGTLDIDNNGTVQGAATLVTTDGLVTLKVDNGTKMLGSDKTPLATLGASVMSPPPSPPASNAIVLAYNFSPDGATFDPALTLIMSYDPAKLPQGVAEKDLYIAVYKNNQWITLQGTVDTQNKIITVKVSGFSSFAILGKVAPPPSSSAAPPPPPPSSSAAPPPPTTPAPQPGSNWPLIVGIIVAIIIIAAVIFLVRRSRRNKLGA